MLGLYSRLDSRGAAAADLDLDGDLDLVVYNRNNPTVKIFRNDMPGQGNVLQVDLRGTESEPLAAGAQAIARCAGRQWLRQVELGSGFLSQSPPRLHYGVGECRAVESLEVVWPSGRRQVVRDLPVNHRVVIAEGEQGFESTALNGRNYNRRELAPSPGELSATRPELRLTRLDDGSELALEALDREIVVLNFWATWCTACALEIPDLESASRRFAGRVRFLGVSLDDPAVGDQEVLAWARERGVSYLQLRGAVEDQAPFASLGGSPPGAIPLTAVVDRGTVRMVHVGPVDAEELGGYLEDLAGR